VIEPQNVLDGAKHADRIVERGNNLVAP
jgi:hypothetical protein